MQSMDRDDLPGSLEDTDIFIVGVSTVRIPNGTKQLEAGTVTRVGLT